MTAPHDASGDATPRHVLPIRGSQDAPSLRAIIARVAADVTEDRRRRRLQHVAVTVDVEGSRSSVADADQVRALIVPLVAAACEAAAAPGPASDGPLLHEVVITAVETGRGVEIEIADSGPGPAYLPADVLAAARGHAERIGGSFMVAACPDGGSAVTVGLRSCQQQRRAIRPAA